MEIGPMRFVGRFRLSCVLASAFILAFLLAGLSARSENRGEFRGSYEVRNVVHHEGHVRLTLDVELSNHTNTDVADAIVTLRDVRLLPKVYGSFPAVSISAGQSIRMSREFNVPVREYQHLQQGAHPTLVIEFRDAGGNLVRHRVITEGHGSTGGEE